MSTTNATIPTTVEVPGALLVEAAGYVDALDSIATEFGVELGKDAEQTSSTRALALVCELATAAGCTTHSKVCLTRSTTRRTRRIR